MIENIERLDILETLEVLWKCKNDVIANDRRERGNLNLFFKKMRA